MTKNIRGITVEIGGDTTKLGKALQDVDKQSRSLSGELKDIDKLLKLDPGNTELLAQKQKVLAQAVDNTSDKLKTLKEAEKQVQEQFKRGEVSEEQVRALQREIVSTSNELKNYKKEIKKTSDGLDDMSKSSNKAGDSASSLGSKLGSVVKGGLSALSGILVGIGTAMIGSAEASREYRTDMGKLETAFTSAGHSAETATETYKSLQGILGDSAQAVEASNHLAKLCDSEEDLANWTNIATGVYATFGDSLPIESLTEASNETAKTGQITGSLADALNWAGVSEDEFQAKLDACTTEQERQAIITDTLNGLYSESAEKYRETNAEIIRANEANESFNESMAQIGASVEPLLTDIKMLGASLVADLVPGVTQVAEAFRGMLNGDEGASENLGVALSGIIMNLQTKIMELTPMIVNVGMNLITTLTTSLISSLPQFVTTGVQMVLSIVNGLTTAIPQIITALVNMIPQLVVALTTAIPQLIQGAVDLFMALVQAIPLIIPPLIEAIPTIIMSVLNALVTAIPQLIEGALQFFMAIVQAIPLIIQELVPVLPDIITTIIDCVIDNIPVLLDAAYTLFFAIVDAIPMIVLELVKALPQILDAIIDALSKLPGLIWDILTTVIGKFIEWGTNVRKNAGSTVTQLVSEVFNTLSYLPNKIRNAIWGAISTVVSWGGEMLTKAKKAAGDVVIGISEKLRETVGKVKSIGKDIVEGLWNGINDKVEWIKEKLMGFKDAVLDKLKEVFGIASPSKVMKREVGRYIAEGIGAGILESDSPTMAINQVKDDILNGVDDINGATIDRKLNATFSGNVDSIAMSNQNLADKLDGIYERLGRLQIVLDTGTLVGETIDKIDVGLSNKQLLSARGV